MDKNSLQVSIIMATYNRAHFITEALDSILNQTFQGWECLIIDDGSTDTTLGVLSPYLEKDPRLKYYLRSAEHKKGLSGCRNMGLELAKGDCIIFFDDDDFVHPQNLELCLEAFRENEIDFCAYRKQPFFKDKSEIEITPQELKFDKKIDIFKLGAIIKNEIPLASCCVMWKKTCFEEAHFNETLMYAEEWECYSRIISHNKKGVFIRNILYFNRKHPNSNTGEFYNNNPIRKASKVKAVKLVVENLAIKKRLGPELVKFFIRTGFSLDELSIIAFTLKKSEAGILKRLKYKLGYIFYPVLRPIFKWKGKMNQ